MNKGKLLKLINVRKEFENPNTIEETTKSGLINFLVSSIQNISSKLSKQKTTTQKSVVLEKFNFEMGTKERVLLIGESGSGKSVFMHIISGISLPSSGNFLINGEEVNAYNLGEINKDILLLESDEGMFKNKSWSAAFSSIVLSYLKFGVACNADLLIQNISTHLENIRMQDILYKNTGTLSKGMNRAHQLATVISMIEIGMFLQNDFIQDLYIDEPMTGLDDSRAYYFLNKLVELDSKGYIKGNIVMCEHQYTAIEYLIKRGFLHSAICIHNKIVSKKFDIYDTVVQTVYTMQLLDLNINILEKVREHFSATGYTVTLTNSEYINALRNGKTNVVVLNSEYDVNENEDNNILSILVMTKLNVIQEASRYLSTFLNSIAELKILHFRSSISSATNMEVNNVEN